jgi:lambda repressor-like predicted transcriptional regulator
VRSRCVSLASFFSCVSNARLRRLEPDVALIRRRAAGESLRALALDYGVAHTTLARYFRRNNVAKELHDADKAWRRAARREQAERRRMEPEIRRKAKQEAALTRAFSKEEWYDEHDRRRPLLRRDLLSKSDELAARAVDESGGLDAVIEATDLRSFGNIARRIDPAILVRAYDNEALARALAFPESLRLRRLRPDPPLMQRRAAGEPLRRLARDYGVSHTTLSRWFARSSVAAGVNELERRQRRRRTL